VIELLIPEWQRARITNLELNAGVVVIVRGVLDISG
jgi:hypothetical protein